MILDDHIISKLDYNILEELSGGKSGAGVYIIDHMNSIKVLKLVDCSNSFINELEVEYQMLQWLEKRFSAPRPDRYVENSDYNYIIMSKLDGCNLKEIIADGENIKDIVNIYGKTLRRLHSIDISGCPRYVDIDTMIREIKDRMDADNPIENAEEKYEHMTAGELHARMVDLKPKDDDTVFTHGDYCFDNIILEDDGRCSIIDVGRAGIGDRYRDIALAVRSIEHSCGSEWVSEFYEAYGIEDVDEEKIEFYIIMDEFF